MKPQSVASNALVERAARAALLDTQETLPDLLVDGFPFTPALWMIVVEPLLPRTKTDSGLFTVVISQEAESYQVTVGRVLRVGPAAMDGKTTGGVELSNFTAAIRTPSDLIGKYVIYQRHVGQELTLRKTEQVVKVMKLTDLLGVTEDPYAWKFYI